MGSAWADVASGVFIVVTAAATGGGAGFWLAAEWMNLDDRGMVGDPYPRLVMTLATVGGAVLAGGLALLAVWWWG